jgi:aryl-alcohol dehydrogenase-like predicted oxidoreductase
VSRLALGTVQFGLSYGIANNTGQVARSEAIAMLQLAFKNGIDTLDTAVAYGDSEACLGEVGAQDFKLVTKLPAMPPDCADVVAWVRLQIVASLTRLRVNSIYGVLLHRSEQLLGPNGAALYQALQIAKDNGLVKKIGVSIYSTSELESLIPQYCFDLVQAPLNLVDRRLNTTGWLRRLKQDGVEIHIRSVFLQGLLLMPLAAIPIKFAPWNDLWLRWHQWLADHDVSAVQACLAYPLSFPEIDRIVVGADSAGQLAQIILASSNSPQIDLPNLECGEGQLINPNSWSKL